MAAIGASPYRVSPEKPVHEVTVRRKRLANLLGLFGTALALVLGALYEIGWYGARSGGSIGLWVTLAFDALLLLVIVAQIVPALGRGGTLTVSNHRVRVERLDAVGSTFIADAPVHEVEGVTVRTGKLGKQPVYGVELRLSRGRVAPIAAPGAGLSEDEARRLAAEAWALVQRAQRREL